MSYNETDVRRLGEILDTIELAEGERAALESLVTFAARRPSELAEMHAAAPGERMQRVLPQLMFDTEPTASL